MSAPESKKNEPRFSHQSACTHGWTLKSYDRQPNINLPINLKLGPPIKINSPGIFVKPPRGWDSPVNMVESVFNVRKESDLPSHAVIVSNVDNSGKTDVVTPKDTEGWKKAMEPNDWEEFGYGTFYWDATTAKAIIEYVFRNHAIIPSGTKLPKIGNRVAQAFLTGTKASGSLTHRDETSSLLYVVTGSKIVYLAPPGAEVTLKMAINDLLFLDYNPDNDTRRNETLWKKISLNVGDSLFIPKGWWHYVRSTPGTVALSLVLAPSPNAAPGLNSSSNSTAASASNASNESSASSSSSSSSLEVIPLQKSGSGRKSGSENNDDTKIGVTEVGVSQKSLKRRQTTVTKTRKKSKKSMGKKSKKKKKIIVEEDVDDMSSQNWKNVVWASFFVCKKCQWWPAAVLKTGQIVYVGNKVEVTNYEQYPFPNFEGTEEDVKLKTNGYRKSKELNYAIRLAIRFRENE